MRAAAGFVVAAALVGAATAAELPSREEKSKPVEAKVRACEIDGERGMELPGGTCVRVSGYFSAEVSAGTLKH